jgi:hypothetical protein
MEDFGARNSSSVHFCQQRAAECDLFVGIIGHLYGSSPSGSSTSFTEIEYDSAIAARRPTLMFLSPNDFPLAADLVESDDRRESQRAFRRRINENTVRAAFSSPSELAWRVVQAIMNHEMERRTTVPDNWQAPNTQLEQLLVKAQVELEAARERLQEQEDTISSLLIASTQSGSSRIAQTSGHLTQDPVATFSIDSATVRQSSHVTIQIGLDARLPGVGAVDLQVRYDPARLLATSCAGKNVIGNPAFSSDTVAFSGANIEGWAGRLVWAEITFRALPDAALGSTQLNVSIQTLADTTGSVIGPATVVQGLVHILPSITPADEIDSAVASLKSRVIDVNAYDWNQADVFAWAGEELVLQHLSEAELAMIVARKMKMRNAEVIPIRHVLTDWDLTGLITWELITPEPSTDALTGFPVQGYNSYRLTDLGKLVLERLKADRSNRPTDRR